MVENIDMKKTATAQKIETIINPTSSATEMPTINWWQTAGGSNVLRYFQDAVIDAIVNITSMNDDKYADNTRLFWLFLIEIKLKSPAASTLHEILSTRLRFYAADGDKWKDKAYQDESVLKLAVEFAESIFEVKKIYLERLRSAQEQVRQINSK